LKLPTLAQRKEDIPLIISNYLTQHYPELTIQTKTLNHFTQFDYFGNIRQLINLIERCVVMTDYSEISYSTVVEICNQEFSMNDKISEIRTPSVTTAVSEKEQIKQALSNNLGNRQKTASELGISTATLWRKMKKNGLL
jgi:DNA-binding NtrC family response regulator